MHRQHDHAAAQLLRGDFLQRRGPVDSRHAQIQDHHIGLQPLRQVDDLSAIGCFTDHLDVAGHAQQRSQTRSNDSMIVREDNANHIGGHDCLRCLTTGAVDAVRPVIESM